MANEVCLKTDCLHIKRGGIELEVRKESVWYFNRIECNNFMVSKECTKGYFNELVGL